jgi:hypothetical protein
VVKEEIGREGDEIQQRDRDDGAAETQPHRDRRQNQQPAGRGEVAETREGDRVVHYGLGSL